MHVVREHRSPIGRAQPDRAVAPPKHGAGGPGLRGRSRRGLSEDLLAPPPSVDERLGGVERAPAADPDRQQPLAELEDQRFVPLARARLPDLFESDHGVDATQCARVFGEPEQERGGRCRHGELAQGPRER